MRVFKIAVLSLSAVAVLGASMFFGTLFLLRPPGLEVPAQSSLALSGMTLINPTESRVTGHTLRIHQGQIASIEQETAESDFDCDGCFVLPGLIDMHVHFPPTLAVGQQQQFSLLFLAHGVTRVRDAGTADLSAFALRDRISNGTLVGPQIMSCGPIIDGDPPAFPTNVCAETPEQASEAVRIAADEGADCIKVYNMLPGPAFEAIMTAADELGLPVMGHVPHNVGLSATRNLDIQHVTGVVEYEPSEIGFDDYRFVDIATLDEGRLDAVVASVLANNNSFTPTLINQVRRRTWADEERYPPDPTSAQLPEFWPIAWRAILVTPSMGTPKPIMPLI